MRRSVYSVTLLCLAVLVTGCGNVTLATVALGVTTVAQDTQAVVSATAEASPTAPPPTAEPLPVPPTANAGSVAVTAIWFVPTATRAPGSTPAATPDGLPTPALTPAEMPTRAVETPTAIADTPTPLIYPTIVSQEWRILNLLVGPGSPGCLYAFLTRWNDSEAPERFRLLVSDDGGASWAPFAGGLPRSDCLLAINMDYERQDALYASTCDGLYSWNGSALALLSPQPVRTVAVVYGRPQTIWAAGLGPSEPAALRSDDGGRTWMPAGEGLVDFSGLAKIAVDPRDANTIYAIILPKYAGTYLRRGTGAGQWHSMPTPGDTVIQVGMAIDGATGAMYVTTMCLPYQLWRSPNPSEPDVSAVRWELVHEFGDEWQVELLASGPGPTLYANFTRVHWLEDGGIPDDALLYISHDGGSTWKPLPIARYIE